MMKATRKPLIFLALLLSAVAAYSQCDTFWQKAETLFSQKKYEDAKKQYLNYKECIPPPHTEVDKKIAECDCKICLQKADLLFSQKKYADAKKQYESCKTCSPIEVIQKIAECDKLCNAYTIKSISKKKAKVVKVCGGNISNVSNGDVLKVYEIKTDGSGISKIKIGELKVTAVKSDVIECKVKDGEKKITGKINSRANIIVEK